VELAWLAKFKLNVWAAAPFNGSSLARNRTVSGRPGQQAVELKINVPPNNEAPPQTTAARLWVDATTYLPMRQYLRMSNGQQNVTDYIYLPPTPANLAKLHPEIPAGHTHVSGSSADLFGRKPKTEQK